MPIKKVLEKVRSFGLYINGLRSPKEGFDVQTHPTSGKVVGRVFLTPQDSLLFEEATPTEEITEFLK